MHSSVLPDASFSHWLKHFATSNYTGAVDSGIQRFLMRQTDGLQVANVLWPLLDYSTNTANAESETLLEEGIRLLQAILSACPDLPQPVLVSSLPRILRPRVLS